MSHLFDLGPSVPGTSRNDLWHGNQVMPWGNQTGFGNNAARTGGFQPYQSPWFGQPNFSTTGQDTFNGAPVNVRGGETRAARSSPMQQVAMEGLKMTAAIAMGSLGFFLAGPGGAMVLGSLTAGGLSALDSWRRDGKVDLVRTFIDGAIGAIPGFGQGAKIAGKITETLTVRAAPKLAATLQRGFVAGMVDGGLMGGLSGGLNAFFEDIKQREFNPLNILSGLFSGALWGAAFGGLVGSAASGLGRWRIRTRPEYLAVTNRQARADLYKTTAQSKIYGDSVAFSTRPAAPTTPSARSSSRGATEAEIKDAWY